MSIIGNFNREGNDFVGSIATLAVRTKATIRAIEKTSENAPDYRVTAGGVDIGGAWAAKSKADRDYLSVKLDDPSFPAPIFARLVGLDGGEQALVWTR